jgi:hypothetical protein
MCTVTFIPVENKVFLCSNRDEKNLRAAAFPPSAYELNTGQAFFPKDADAGGTWIAVHENGNAIVLLNGGIRKHESLPPYRRSRGLILLDVIDSETPFTGFGNIDLHNIEPFTVIIWDDNRLYECRWDGANKHVKKLNNTVPHIWSSVTLYTDEVIRRREVWYQDWLKTHSSPSPEDILQFHQFTGDGDDRNDLLMNRDGEMYTVSITLLELSGENSQMHYIDLKNNTTTVSTFDLKKPLAI